MTFGATLGGRLRKDENGRGRYGGTGRTKAERSSLERSGASSRTRTANGDWTHRGQGTGQRHRDDGRREEVVRPDLLDHLLPRGAVARGARAHVARRLHVARGGEDRRDHRAGGRGGAVLPDVPGRYCSSRDDGDIAGRPGVGTGLSPVLKQWLARLHRPLGCSVRCATCARGTIPHPRPTQLFSQVKACYRGRRWRAFPIPYAVSPCARGRLRHHTDPRNPAGRWSLGAIQSGDPRPTSGRPNPNEEQ